MTITIHSIADSVDPSDQGTLDKASVELAKITDLELLQAVVLSETSSGMSNATRKSVALARMELERRKLQDTRKLTMASTRTAGWMAVLGTVAGAIVGAIIASLIS